MSKCAWSSCITLLYSGNPGPYCFIHTLPDYKWERDDFLATLREPGIPPRGSVECECGRIHKSSTSCVCKARPAPRQEWAA